MPVAADALGAVSQMTTPAAIAAAPTPNAMSDAVAALFALWVSESPLPEQRVDVRQFWSA